MLTLYGYPDSRSLRVSWMLEELGVDYHYQLVDLAKREGQSPVYLAINPGAKVPALQDDQLVLTESAAIITYLGDKYPEQSLVPTAGSSQRAIYEQWSYFAISELEQPLWTMGKHKFVLPKERRVKEVLPTAQWEFQTALALLSQGLGEKDYILGDQFSAADILLGQTLLWGLAFKQAIEQANLQPYVDRLKQRPALVRALEKETIK